MYSALTASDRNRCQFGSEFGMHGNGAGIQHYVKYKYVVVIAV